MKNKFALALIAGASLVIANTNCGTKPAEKVNVTVKAEEKGVAGRIKSWVGLDASAATIDNKKGATSRIVRAKNGIVSGVSTVKRAVYSATSTIVSPVVKYPKTSVATLVTVAAASAFAYDYLQNQQEDINSESGSNN